jgi:hypothetical protein
MINTLLERNVERQRIWYFSFDEEKYDLDELFTFFKTQRVYDKSHNFIKLQMLTVLCTCCRQHGFMKPVEQRQRRVIFGVPGI